MTLPMKTKLKVAIDSKERPELDPIDLINFILEQLRADNSVDVGDGITWDANVTFEELIGVLLSARDELKLSQSDANSVDESHRASITNNPAYGGTLETAHN